MNNINNKKIIGYFHICQKGEWRSSFDIIFNYIKNYGLYDITSEIRLGIVNDEPNIIDDFRLHNSKFKIIFHGKSDLYERPTLINMRTESSMDSDNTVYWYLHTKGLRHFGTKKESFVVDWIKLMLYWNIRKWNIALKSLETFDTYGCNNYKHMFYSGNFWWATVQRIRKLPVYIEDYYTAPEDWIMRIKTNNCEIFSSGLQGDGHYNLNYPESKYMYPEDLKKTFPTNFYIDTYKIYHKELNNKKFDEVIEHYFSRNHNKKYERSEIMKRIPDNFNYKKYSYLINYSEEEIIFHAIMGSDMNLQEEINIEQLLPNDFDCNTYRNNYNDLKNLTDEELKNHWIQNGRNENRTYKKIKYFDYKFYKETYPDLKNLSDKELLLHWENHGKKEGRICGKVPNDFNHEKYKKRYADLEKLSDKQLERHWIINGVNEDRKYK
jgi:hypothetical protein